MSIVYLILYILHCRYGVLTYALLGTDADNFRINSATGDVLTTIMFSYTGKKTYYFNITATDLGGIKAQVQVQVQILR